MMKLNCKAALGIGVALSIGAVLWMRDVASWRPVTVAKVNFRPWQLRFSRDGNSLLVRGNNKEQIINLKRGVTGSTWQGVGDFEARYGLETFPRIWVDEKQARLYFSPRRGQNIRLEQVKGGHHLALFPDNQSLNFSWSKSSGEVYGEAEGVIFTWNWRDGILKKRQRYGKSPQRKIIFSPDGKWLLAYEKGVNKKHNLWRYDVRTGKTAVLIEKARDFFDCGFSPDGKFIYFVETDSSLAFQVIRNSDLKPVWKASWFGSTKWLPDGRIGIVGSHGFEWRDAAGHSMLQLRGPFNVLNDSGQNLCDWTISPDGNWIYSVDLNGIIRKWRAR